MAALYLSLFTSEGIADRGEVSYEVWHRWIAEDYVYGPYDSIVCTYGTIEGFIESTGDREMLARLVDDPGDRFDGYWRVVKREVFERFSGLDSRLQFARFAGEPRSLAHPPDESLPPFSDWSVDVVARVEPRRIREVDAYRPGSGQLGA